jgi:putative oxidoreductase
MVEWLLQTDSGAVGLILRLTLAVVFFPHGAQKVFGWFGGQGLKNTLQFFTSAGIPTGLALLAIAAEFLGSIGLAVGLLTRVAAFGIACVMLVAIATVHWQQGFFMNWFGDKQGEGFEYHLLALGIAIVLIIRGGRRVVGGWRAGRRRPTLAVGSMRSLSPVRVLCGNGAA